MKKIVLLLSSIALAVLLACGATLAADTSSPGPVTNFFSHAQNSSTAVSLRWSNPANVDFSATKILRSTVGFATTPDQVADQTHIYEGASNSYEDTGLTTGTTYYYTAFAKNTSGNWSVAKTVTGLPSNARFGHSTIPVGPFPYDSTPTFTGAIESFGQEQLVGRTVTVWSSVDNGNTYTQVGAFTQDGQKDPTYGQYEFTTAPLTRNTIFNFRFAGDAEYSATNSQYFPVSVRPQPNTTITSSPSAVVNSTSASFGFSSTEPGAKFQCSLNGAAFAPCISPKRYMGLSNRLHTFKVRAVNAALSPDPTPAIRTWRVDTIRPKGSVVINGGATTTRSRTVKLAPRATDPAPASGVALMRFKNAGPTIWSAWQPYSTAKKTWKLTPGAGKKTVYAQYRDKAGNVSGSVSTSIYDKITYRP